MHVSLGWVVFHPEPDAGFKNMRRGEKYELKEFHNPTESLMDGNDSIVAEVTH